MEYPMNYAKPVDTNTSKMEGRLKEGIRRRQKIIKKHLR